MILAREAGTVSYVDDNVAGQFERVSHVLDGDYHIVVDVAIKDKLNDAPEDPLHAALEDAVLFFIKISPAERCKIHDRKERENNVRKNRRATGAR